LNDIIEKSKYDDKNNDRYCEEEDCDSQEEKVVTWPETIDYVQCHDNIQHPQKPDVFSGAIKYMLNINDIFIL